MGMICKNCGEVRKSLAESGCSRCGNRHWMHSKDAPACVPVKKLKTIEEYKEEVRTHTPVRYISGIACPKCGQEMEWDPATATSLLCDPPINYQDAYCPDCLHRVNLRRS